MVDYGAGIDPNNNNLQTLKSSLMVNGVTAAGIFMAFSILRTRLDYVYSPRSFLADDKKQFQKPPASGILSSFSWVYPKVIIPMTENGRRTYKILAGRELDREIIKRTSLDAYMFLRMMRMMFTVFALMCVPSVGLLLPLNKRGGNHQAGIDAYSMKNIERGNNALWAHVIYALVFVCVVVYNIINELSVYVQLRRNYLLSPEHASSARSATVMVNSVPRELMDKRKLEKLFSVFPDGVKEVYLSRDVRRITEVVAQRSEYRAKVEKILTKYAIKCDEYYRYRSAAEDAETFELQDRRQRKRGIGTLPMHTNDDALSTPSHARA
ncbi:phosphate metabolism protein 7, partial [Spiromyces aspiralis]